MKYLIPLMLSVLLSSPVLAADPQPKAEDTRHSLGFNDEEKALFLSEMRQMLVSIQGIMQGIAENNPELIIKSAKYSGNRMARETPESIKQKTPPEFKELGGPTHMMFEELVIRAEDEDMQSLTLLTSDILKNCVACHSQFKAD